MAWVGFGIALTLFILVWVVNSIFFCANVNSVYEGVIYFPLFFIILIVGSILGLVALILSILGLVSANKNSLKKFPGVAGIVLICLSVISAFIPWIVMAFSAISDIASHEHEIINAVYDTETIRIIQEDDDVSEIESITLCVGANGRVECTGNTDFQPHYMTANTDREIYRQLKTWMRINNIEKSVPFVITMTEDAKYDNIVNIIMALQKLGIKRYKIET